MQSRVARVMLGALLLAVAIGAALQFNFQLTQSRQLADARQAVLAHIASFDAAAAELGAAQAAYVAPGQPDAPWIEQVAALSERLTALVGMIRSAARSPDSAPHLQAMGEAVSRVTAADVLARDYLRQDDDLMAADVIFGEGRQALAAAREAAASLSGTEGSAYEADRTALERRLMLIPAVTAAALLIGLAILIPRPAADPVPPAVPDHARVDVPVEREAGAAAPAVDLAAAADLCTDLSRISSSSALPDMLARAAALLDATGVIVWMGSGGELVAASTHGYNPQVIRRLGAIPRDADNATAAAWRTGEIRTVPGDSMSNGAIVAPMFGPDSCIGVLAAEVRHGREHDEPTQAVTMMVAAQLAAVLAAWPAPTPARAEL